MDFDSPSLRRPLIIVILVMFIAGAVLWPLYEHLKWKAKYAQQKPCFEVIKLDAPSPGAQTLARVERVTCGKTSTTYVTLRDAAQTTVDHDVDSVLTIDGECPLRLHWKDDSNLEVMYLKCPGGKVRDLRPGWHSIHTDQQTMEEDGKLSATVAIPGTNPQQP